MSRAFKLFTVFFFSVFIIDQFIKGVFLNGFYWYGKYFSLILAYNKGVALSMLSFLEGELKYVQLVCLAVVFVYLLKNTRVFTKYAHSLGIIFGAALSNIYDRFMHGGVVDYFFWHYGINLPVLNFADIMIDVGIVALIYTSFKPHQVPGNFE